MARIILITGGSRSGKSGFAQRLAEDEADPRLFLATCPKTDPEMEERIRRHRLERQSGGWLTREEPLALSGVLDSQPDGGTILIDCLTLWINNLLHDSWQRGVRLTEERVSEETDALLQAARRRTGTVFMVTSEVGLGIVPDNEQARLFRDLVGRCNQCVAAEADEMYLISCGIPLQLKGAMHAI